MNKYIEVALTVGGVDLTVSGYYLPEESSEMYDDNMEGYPGAPAEFQLDSVQVDGREIIEIISDDVYGEIIEQVLEHYEDN